jgi:hypothetical protein
MAQAKKRKRKHKERGILGGRRLPPVDPNQRYTIKETAALLRMGVSSVYTAIGDGSIRSFKDGNSNFIPGTEIIRKSTFPDSVVPALPDPVPA